MIEWIVTSSALILLVIFLRVLIKNRVGPRLRYALWGLVLLRLLVPVSLWESRASVMTPVAAQEPYQAIERIPRYVRTRPDGWVEIGRPGGGGWTSIPKERVETGEIYYGWPSMKADLETLREQVTVRDAFVWAWLAGTAIVGAFLLAVNLRFAHNLKKNRRTVGQYRGRWVFVWDGLATPCLFGLFRPGIYLTQAVAEDDSARAHVLAHEYTHFRQGDHIWAALRGVCLAVHWYNPLVWLAAALSRRDCELSCDEGAVRLLGEDRRADYGRTLVGLVARRTTPKDLACCATTMTGGKSALKERIALLVKRPRTTAAMACVVAAVCIVFMLCTFTGAAAEEEPDIAVEPPQAEADFSQPEGPDAAEPVEQEPDGCFEPLPEDLPTELMDLDRPLEEQGAWLLLAQVPDMDISLYRRADDSQKVYLRMTNQCFQVFERDLSEMELLPTMELWDGGGDLTVQVLYRRYEGTYFNGTSYEPGVVAEMAIYTWNAAGKYWTEGYISTQPLQRLTEDLPALADLPTRLVRPRTPETKADIWLIGELPEDDIAVYYEYSTAKYWLRYGSAIQKVEGMTASMPQMILPELYFDDLDGDGSRELIVISPKAYGTGIAQQQLSVYEWDGEAWTWDTHDPSGLIGDFNSQRVYQFYEDGTAYISYLDTDILLDLSGLRASGDSAPDVCILNDMQVSYFYEDGQITLSLEGEILDNGGDSLSGDTFEYVCPVSYSYDHLGGWSGVLRSDFAVQQAPPALTDTYRAILRKTLAECNTNSPNAFAVCDVNGDGTEELLVRWMPANAIASAWGTTLYNADGVEYFHGYGELTFYDNGVISEPWSHNQGPACAIWPYTLYQHDPQTGGYIQAGGARARSDKAEGFEAAAAADLDGDGMVYYIGEDAYREENPVDNAAYETWRGRYLNGAKVLPVRYYDLTAEAIS